MEALGEMLDALLGAEFPNLCLVTGLLLFLLGIFDGGFKIGKVKLPRVGKIGQIASGIMGVVLLLVPTVGYFVGTTIGFRGSDGKDSNPHRTSISLSLVAPAWAQDKPQLLASQRIPQRRIRIVTLKAPEFSDEVGVYVGDVHLRKPSRILIFRDGSAFRELGADRKIEYRDLKNELDPKHVLQDATVKQGVQISFRLKGRLFILKVPVVLWSFFGTGHIEVEIYSGT